MQGFPNPNQPFESGFETGLISSDLHLGTGTSINAISFAYACSD